jgi:hypothetical protein
MEREKVLIFDNKRLFLEMFKKDLGNEFKFNERSFLNPNEIEKNKDFDTCIFVVYDKLELIEFLKIERKEKNVLMCLFDEKLYGNISFLEEINDLIMLDGYKTRRIFIRDLKQHLKNTSKSKKQFMDCIISNGVAEQTQSHSFFKTFFLFI